jgi:hypothetical protein
MNPSIKTPPFWRVLLFWLNVFESNGEVDKEKIEIVQAPEAELLFGDRVDLWTSLDSIALCEHGTYVFLGMEGIPELKKDGMNDCSENLGRGLALEVITVVASVNGTGTAKCSDTHISPLS